MKDCHYIAGEKLLEIHILRLVVNNTYWFRNVRWFSMVFDGGFRPMAIMYKQKYSQIKYNQNNRENNTREERICIRRSIKRQ